jgi:hypothetical protein
VNKRVNTRNVEHEKASYDYVNRFEQRLFVGCGFCGPHLGPITSTKSTRTTPPAPCYASSRSRVSSGGEGMHDLNIVSSYVLVQFLGSNSSVQLIGPLHFCTVQPSWASLSTLAPPVHDEQQRSDSHEEERPTDHPDLVRHQRRDLLRRKENERYPKRRTYSST